MVLSLTGIISNNQELELCVVKRTNLNQYWMTRQCSPAQKIFCINFCHSFLVFCHQKWYWYSLSCVTLSSEFYQKWIFSKYFQATLTFFSRAQSLVNHLPSLSFCRECSDWVFSHCSVSRQTRPACNCLCTLLDYCSWFWVDLDFLTTIRLLHICLSIYIKHHVRLSVHVSPM